MAVAAFATARPRVRRHGSVCAACFFLKHIHPVPLYCKQRMLRTMLHGRPLLLLLICTHTHATQGALRATAAEDAMAALDGLPANVVVSNTTLCPVGTSLEGRLGDNKVCQACAQGSYSALVSDSPCLPCPPGTYSNRTSSVYCTTVGWNCTSFLTGATDATMARTRCQDPETGRSLFQYIFVSVMVLLVLVCCCCGCCYIKGSAEASTIPM